MAPACIWVTVQQRRRPALLYFCTSAYRLLNTFGWIVCISGAHENNIYISICLSVEILVESHTWFASSPSSE